jgi:hypothetical protein
VITSDSEPSTVAELRSAFEAAALAVPTVPTEFADTLEHRGAWCWSTEPLDTTPYLVEEFVRAFEVDPTHDRLVVAHAGHGMASWFLCYYVSIGSVGVFVHSAWGSSLDSEEHDAAARARFAARLHDADEFIARARANANGSVVAVVASDTAGDRWASWLPGSRPDWQRDHSPFAAALASIE